MADRSVLRKVLTTAAIGGATFLMVNAFKQSIMRYLEAQRQAIQRGVKIRRVFVFDRPELASNDDIIGMCKLQQSYGIEVRVLSPLSIPSIRRIALFDFVIFDEVVSYELIAASPLEDGEQAAIHSTRLELGRHKVQDRIRRFRDLWESAHELQ